MAEKMATWPQGVGFCVYQTEQTPEHQSRADLFCAHVLTSIAHVDVI